MKKRLICFFAFFMLWTISVCAEEGYGWSISKDYEVLTISDFDNMTSYAWNEKYGDNIKEVIIKEGVTQIPEMAFRQCINLKKITIPSTVTDIDSAFNEGFLIKEVHISDLSAWCSIDFSKTISNPLYYGAKLYINGSFFEDLVIPDGVASIEDFAFYNYSYLKSVTIPKSLTSIGNYVFQKCSALSHIYYSGTEVDWERISIGSNNHILNNAKIFYNYTEPFSKTEIVGAVSTDNSLKFISKVEIAGKCEIKSFGTTFIPLWLFEDGRKDAVSVGYDNLIYDIKDEQTFGASLNNIPESFKDTYIVGKSFIEYSDGTYEWSKAKYASVTDTNLHELEK